MPKLYLTLSLFVILNVLYVAPSNAQSKYKKLLFIDGMPIKIDDGCSFFLEQHYSMVAGKSQLTINAYHTAFIEFLPGTFIFFKRVKREKNTNGGYTEYYKGTKAINSWYKGKIGSFTLKIDTIKKYMDYSTIRSGTLYMDYPGFKQTLKVHGKVDERDEYYYQLYPKLK